MYVNEWKYSKNIDNIHRAYIFQKFLSKALQFQKDDEYEILGLLISKKPYVSRITKMRKIHLWPNFFFIL